MNLSANNPALSATVVLGRAGLALRTCSRTLAPYLGMCVTEARPVVLGMFGLRFCCGALLAAPAAAVATGERLLVGLVAWELAVVSVYLLNGVQDVAEDRVNRSARPIARGDLPPQVALAAAVSCAAGALLASGLAGGPLAALLVAAFLALGVLYSCPPVPFKSSATGSAVSGTLFGLLSYCAGLAAPGGQGPQATWLAFALPMALWTGLVGSLTKDLSDVAGDAAAGRRTAPVVFGVAAARHAAVLTAGGIAIGLAATAGSMAPELLPAAVTAAAGAALVARACRRPLPPAGVRDRAAYRAFMVTQYAAHVCALAAVLVLSRP